jgi:hypothetical protein
LLAAPHQGFGFVRELIHMFQHARHFLRAELEDRVLIFFVVPGVGLEPTLALPRKGF